MNKIIVSGRAVRPAEVMKDLGADHGRHLVWVTGCVAVYGGKNMNGGDSTYFMDYTCTTTQETADKVGKGDYIILSGEMVYTEGTDKRDPVRKRRWWKIRADKLEAVKSKAEAEEALLQFPEAKTELVLGDEDDLPF